MTTTGRQVTEDLETVTGTDQGNTLGTPTEPGAGSGGAGRRDRARAESPRGGGGRKKGTR